MPFAADKAEAASPEDRGAARAPPLVGVGVDVGDLVPEPVLVTVGALVLEAAAVALKAW
jgi:hypothetical protein